MQGHVSHRDKNEKVPKDSLPKHILLRDFRSQGNQHQETLHSSDSAQHSSTQTGSFSLKHQQPLLFGVLSTHYQAPGHFLSNT